MAWAISSVLMYSSAVCEREESPGPILTDGKGISAWLERVGEPKGVSPRLMAFRTNGWVGSILDELRRNDRATAVPCRFSAISSNISWFV